MFILDVTNFAIAGIISDQFTLRPTKSRLVLLIKSIQVFASTISATVDSSYYTYFHLAALVTRSSSLLLQSNQPKKWCQLKNTLHTLKVSCKIINLCLIRCYNANDFYFEHFVEIVALFCREIKRLLGITSGCTLMPTFSTSFRQMVSRMCARCVGGSIRNYAVAWA